jgi:cell shape-determining protein MreD
MLVLLIAWLMVRGPGEALVLIPFAGIVLGLVDGAPMGTALLALSPIAILDDLRGSRLREGALVQTIMFTALMTLTYHFVYLLVFLIQGESGSLLAALLRASIPACFLNVIVLLPIYFVLWASSHDLRRAAYV